MIGALSRRTPLVLQMEAAECGAACLAMVLARHGRWIPLEESRARCGTSRDGVTLAGLAAAARSYGLKAVALRREPEDLAALPLPQIVHWRFEHFVVLDAIGRDGFTILDPAEGRRVVSSREFGESFTGLVLALEPGPDFSRAGKAPSVAGALVAEALRSKDAMGLAFLAGTLAVIPGIALAGATSAFVDGVLGAGQRAWTPWFLLVLLGIVAVQLVLASLQSWTVATWKIKIGAISALRGFSRALALPLSFFAQRSAGEITARVRLGSEVGGTVAGPLADMAPQAVVAGICFLVLSLYDPAIMIAALIACILAFLALATIARRLADGAREQQVAEGRAAAVATSALAHFETYRALGRERLVLARWSAGEEAAIAAEQRFGLLRALANLGPAATGLVLSGTVLVVGAARAMEGSLSLGDLVAAQMLAGLLNKPIAQLASSFCRLQEAAGALMRLSDLESHPMAGAFDGRERAPAPERAGGRLTLSGIGFAHVPGRPVLADIDLVVEPGRLVAIVGGSGAGKSTLARIAAGMIEPDAGEVALDGRPLVDWPQDALRAALLYVGQNPATFSGTIAENVTLFDRTIPEEAVAAALARVGLAETVARRPAGLATKIAAGATGFSGGELQRLALARALVRRPKALVLDETTSALDPIAEEEMLGVLRASGAAVLVVTHRPGTALRCDEAVLLRDGAIVARGDPRHVFGDPEATGQAGAESALPAIAAKAEVA